MSFNLAIPRAADELTTSWLTAALQSTGSATGTVTAFESSPVGVGVGLVGARARVTLFYEDGTGPSTLIAKFPSPAESSRAVASILGMYRKEARFYEQLAARCALPHADCYYADFDDDTEEFVLLLGDLAGGRTVDQVVGATQHEAELAIDRLAEFHAGFWNDDALIGNGWLGALNDSPFPEAVGFSFAQAWGQVQELFPDQIPADVKAFGDRFTEELPRLLDELSKPPFTLSHGDYRLDNIFFYGNGDMAVCDWQLVDRSRGARDVAYFLTHSLTVEDRERLERPLVERYVARLAAHGIADYDVDTAWHDYRQAALFGLAYAVIGGGGLDHADERATRLISEVLDRSVAAITHLGCLDLVNG